MIFKQFAKGHSQRYYFGVSKGFGQLLWAFKENNPNHQWEREYSMFYQSFQLELIK